MDSPEGRTAVPLSPLRQVNTTSSFVFVSKYYDTAQKILSEPDLFTANDPIKYFREFYLCPVEPPTIAHLVKRTSTQEFISVYRVTTFLHPCSIKSLTHPSYSSI